MPMTDPKAYLMLQFLAWVAERPRGYAEIMEGWKTSCPRLSVWEDAQLDGLVERDASTGLFRVTAEGAALLAASRGVQLLDMKSVRIAS
jgi:hypothetical protein